MAFWFGKLFQIRGQKMPTMLAQDWQGKSLKRTKKIDIKFPFFHSPMFLASYQSDLRISKDSLTENSLSSSNYHKHWRKISMKTHKPKMQILDHAYLKQWRHISYPDIHGSPRFVPSSNDLNSLWQRKGSWTFLLLNKKTASTMWYPIMNVTF